MDQYVPRPNKKAKNVFQDNVDFSQKGEQIRPASSTRRGRRTTTLAWSPQRRWQGYLLLQS